MAGNVFNELNGKKSWSDRQKADKKRRQETPTMKERAKASRVQYTLPAYRGRSDVPDTDSYKWEKDLLKEVKGMGRSYNDKFKNLTKSWGMTETDADEFRKFLDFKEDSQQKLKLKKDGELDKRSSAHLGQGAKLENDLFDGIIASSNKQFAKNMKQREKDRQQEVKKQEEINSTIQGKERDGVLGFLDDTLGRASRSAQRTLLGDAFVSKQDENYRKIAESNLEEGETDKALRTIQNLNAVAGEADGALEKGSDILGTILGEVAPYTVGYGATDKLLKGVKGFQTTKPLVQDLVRGGLTGFGVGNAKAIAQQATDENATDTDYAKRVWLETVLAGGGDALVGGVLRNLNLKGQLDELMKGTGSKPYSNEAFEKMLKETIVPPSSNALASSPVKNALDDVLTQSKIPTSNTDEVLKGLQPNQVDNVSRETIPQQTSNTGTPLGIVSGNVNDGPIAKPATVVDKVKSGKVNLKDDIQKVKSEVISDVQFAKDLERNLAKMDDTGILDYVPDGSVAFKDSLFKGLRAVKRATAQAIQASEKEYGEILKGLRKAKINRADFEEYLLAKHADDILRGNHDKMVRAGAVQDRLEEIEQLVQATKDKKVLKQLADEEKALLKEMPELEPYLLPAKATPEWTQNVLTRWTGTTAMEDAQKAFVTAQQKDLDLLAQAGNYSPAQVQQMKGAHPNYISMRRNKEEMDSFFGAGGNVSKPKQHIIKRKNGSDDQILSPVDSAVHNRILAYNNARKNLAMQRIEKLSGINGATEYFKKLNPYTATESQLMNSVKYFEDGKPVYYEVPPSLKQAFENLEVKQADVIGLGMVKAIANVTRKGATHYNLDFVLKSVFRDAQNPLLTSRTNLHPGEVVLGYMDSFMGKNLEKLSGGRFKSYKDAYEELGGSATGYISMDSASLNKATQALDKGHMGKGIDLINPFKVIQKLGTAVEHGPKLGEFRSAVNKGYGVDDAMHEAVDVIDYADAGKSVRVANKYIPFLNPAIRGNTRVYQAFKENPKAFIGKGLGYITTPTVGIYMMRFLPTTSDEQRSKLRNLKDYQKNLFWYIPVPDSDRLIALPKGHLLAQVFANPVERVLDKVTEEDERSYMKLAQETGTDTLNSLIPPHAMAGVAQLQGVLTNYDTFLDMPIEDASMKRAKPEDRYNVYTSEVAKGAAKMMPDFMHENVRSPAKIDYALKGITGGVGRDVLDVMDNLLAKGGDRPAKVDTILDTLNPARSYTYKDTSSSGVYDRLFKEQQKQEWAGNKESEAKAYYDQMKDLNKEVKEIRESKKLSSKEKQKLIAELRQQQREIGNDAISSGILRK